MASVEMKKHLKMFKCVVVGDGAAGKTSLLTVYVRGEFPEDYLPTVFETYTTEITVNKKKHMIGLWDTAGHEDYDRFRTLSYPNSHVVVICYDVSNRSSFENVSSVWAPEIHSQLPGVPVILAACKTDLRDEHESPNEMTNQVDAEVLTNNENQISKNEMISTTEGEDLARSIQALAFIETSAILNRNVVEVFDAAAELAVKARQKKSLQCHGCVPS